MILVAQSPITWEALAVQVPLVAVALAVAWYAFRHIAEQQKTHLGDVRAQHEGTLRMLSEAHARTEAAKDAQIKDLQTTLAAERAEKDRLIKVVEKFGG